MSVSAPGSQKDLKPSLQWDFSVRRAAEWVTFQEAAFLRLWLWPLLQTRSDWSGCGRQLAGLQWGQWRQTCLEGHRRGHRGKEELTHGNGWLVSIKLASIINFNFKLWECNISRLDRKECLKRVKRYGRKVKPVSAKGVLYFTVGWGFTANRFLSCYI